MSPAQTLGTSPHAAFSTSPNQGSAMPGMRARSVSGNINTIARQLTAFLPPDYPINEENERSESPSRRQGKVRLLLVENINLDAADFLKKAGYEVSRHLKGEGCSWRQKVDHVVKAWSEEELLRGLNKYDAIGIRSKTKITAKVIDANPQVRPINIH
jgi:D-3-phosphoglycerate dehydrogenase